MARFLERYLSFDGRLARLPCFIRGLYLAIAAVAIFFISVPLFAAGGLWWWLGILDVAVSLAILAGGSVSLFVRRLHDLGLSGYHAIWVCGAEVGWNVLSYGPSRAIVFGLPFAAISAWLTFWPGNKEANRFGPVPE
jgi:uncharacterized membrane protein YhaH (DUF805 family)